MSVPAGAKDFDDMHHALGRPADPLLPSYRNAFCCSTNGAEAMRFQELYQYWDFSHRINNGHDAIYVVSDYGRHALADYFQAREAS